MRACLVTYERGPTEENPSGTSLASGVPSRVHMLDAVAVCYFGWHWHYLSNPTCLRRPQLFYWFFVVSRITILCYISCHC